MRRATWMLAGAVTLLLAGCGQKGALYLPDKNAQVVTTPAAPPLPPESAPPKPTDKNEDSQAPK
ncbi:MAG TPA: lipoprotein [Steroidobacteraceae bacterium]|jgi:predicted small lipoprotein YifL|nr:lipoprotein [Steroidobacteraceae bacterium]